MAKKYLSLEEAAQEAGLSVDELKQIRERGEIRGFSDGGTWKFKSDDVEELKRANQADSNPDVPLISDEELDSDSSVIGREEGSSIIGMEEEDLVSEQPTVIRSGSMDDDDDDDFMVGMSSDSDVQLVPNDSPPDDGDDQSSLGDSDSDVRLADSSPTMGDQGSDSDVKLVGGSDSDVQIVGGSDSDVQIVEDDSDSDVQLVDSEKTDKDLPTIDEDSDSDVALVPPADKDSGVSLESGDTDASVFDDDESGISLGDGSSITLASESGISLEGYDDSGISLMDDDDAAGADDDSGINLTPADSGIALESLGDSGIALEDDDNRTSPMVEHSASGDDDDTAMEMPALDDDSEFELSTDASDSGDSGNVIMFDDDADVDDHGATVVKKSNDASAEFDLTGDADEFDLDDSFDDGDEFDEFGDDGFEDDLDVAGEEDDDLDDLDVFDEGADDFDDDFDTGTSSPDFIAPGGKQQGVPAPAEADWGAGPFVGLLLSTLLMIVCGMMMFDLVRSMWSWNDPSGFNSPLLGIVQDLIK